MLFRVLTLLAVTLTASATQAALRLPNIFSDHMVVQQKMPIRVWGWTTAGQEVTVEMGG